MLLKLINSQGLQESKSKQGQSAQIDHTCSCRPDVLTVINKILTSPEAIGINLFVLGVFLEKKIKPQRSSKTFFSLQTHFGTYVNLYLYSFERPFPQGKQKSLMTSRAKPTLCKECNQKR